MINNIVYFNDTLLVMHDKLKQIDGLNIEANFPYIDISFGKAILKGVMGIDSISFLGYDESSDKNIVDILVRKLR